MRVFRLNDDQIVRVDEMLRSDFSCFLWPSAILMTKWLASIAHGVGLPRKVIEIGCGVGLPGIVLSVLGTSVLFTDIDDVNVPLILDTQARLNNLDKASFIKLDWNSESRVVRELLLDHFKSDILPDGLLDIDLITGADLFYEPKLYHPLVRTISTILQVCKRDCHFLTVYQERDSLHSIQHLLEFYNLHGEMVPKSSFIEESPLLEQVNGSEEWNPVEIPAIDSLFCFKISRQGPRCSQSGDLARLEEVDKIINMTEIDWFQ